MKKFWSSQRGDMNIGGILMMGIGMVFLTVGFIIFPIATDAASDLQSYTYSGLSSITVDTYTGFEAIISITPILILVGFLAAAIITGFLGFKVMREGATASFNPGHLMITALSIIFIAIGLIILPVAMDGISSVLAQKGPASQSDTVATGVGVTTGNVTLTEVLFDNSTAEVITITSNISETPAASTYTAATGKLLVASLTANTSRILTTTYNYANIEDAGFTGLVPMLKLSPMLILIGFLSASVFAGFFGIRRMADY